MRRWLPLFVLLSASIVTSNAHAAVIKATFSGTTQTTFVSAGDPCGTGLSGSQACEGLPFTLEFLIDTGLAPADRDAAANIGFFAYFATEGHATTFLSGVGTIAGRQFLSLPPPSTSPQPFNFRQIVALRNDIPNALNTFTLDQISIQLDGSGNASNSTSNPVDRRFNTTILLDVQANRLVGTNLDLLGGLGTIPASQAFAISGSFQFINATGDVNGRFDISSVTFSVVPEPALAALLPLAGAGLAYARRRARR